MCPSLSLSLCQPKAHFDLNSRNHNFHTHTHTHFTQTTNMLAGLFVRSTTTTIAAAVVRLRANRPHLPLARATFATPNFQRHLTTGCSVSTVTLQSSRSAKAAPATTMSAKYTTVEKGTPNSSNYRVFISKDLRGRVEVDQSDPYIT